MASVERSGPAAIAGVVDRPRLYRILDSPALRVCVVQGPSGSGKTTLLRSWALQPDRRETTLWVSLGPGLTTRHAFWRHLVGSATRRGGVARETAAEATEQLNLAVDPVRVAALLLADMGPVVIILDAYEHLDDLVPQIDADLGRLAVAVPGLRLMVTTRGGTGLTELDLPDGGVTRVITLSELALTVEEVGALIVGQAGIDDQPLALSVTAATRGFPLTVRAVALALAQLGRIPRLDSREWDAVVAAKLESLLPDAVAVQFVTDTSVPPYVDIELARRLSGAVDAAGLLQVLERNGFGRWIPYARRRPVFQYVETIRDVFRARASEDRERFRRSSVMTASWLVENEEVGDQALQFAIDGEDYALADRVFASLVISNPESYITDRFLPTLERVPEPVLSTQPMLAFGLGLALMANPVRRLEAPRAFRVAVDSTAQPTYFSPELDAFTHASIRAIARRLALSWRASSEAALAATRLIDAIDTELLPRHGERLGTILRQLCLSIWQGGRIEEALDAARRSVALCTRPAPRNYSMVYAAGISAFAGDSVAAGSILSSIDKDAWPIETRGTSMNAFGLLAEAYVLLDRHDFAAAVACLRDAHAYMRTNESWPFITTAWLQAKHGVGQAHAEAERITRELEGASPPPGTGDNIATEHLYAALAGAWLASGDHRTARRLLGSQPEGSPYLAAARVAALLGAGSDRAALALSRDLLELPDHTVRSRSELQTVAAVAALRQRDVELTWSWLNQAAVAGERSGARLHVALLDARDRRRLRDFAEQHEAPELTRYLETAATEVRPPRLGVVTLTPRETAVLSALSEHDGIRAIAETLFVSPHTVKTQLQSIYRKLGATSRRSAIAAASELGLLDPARAGGSGDPRS